MPTASQTKRKISITILPSLDDILQKISEEENISKSTVIENAVKNYIRKKLEKDVAALAKLSFSDLPSEDEWLEIQSDYE